MINQLFYNLNDIIHTHRNDKGLSTFQTHRDGGDLNVYAVLRKYWGNTNAGVISVEPTKVHTFTHWYGDTIRVRERLSVTYFRVNYYSFKSIP